MAILVDKLKEIKDLGVTSLVDPCPMELGRQPEFAAEAAEKSGVQIIMATGLYNEALGIPPHFRSLDADAIAEASARPSMRFVGVKSVDQQHIQQLHRARQLTVRNRTAQINQVHGILLEYAIAAPKGAGALLRRLAQVLEDAENELPMHGRGLLRELGDEVRRHNERVGLFERQLRGAAQQMPACQRLMRVPGIGMLTATALVASVGDAAEFRNGRQLAAWLGIVPRQSSTGGRSRLLGISKRGDRYLRFLLIHGARSALRTASRRSDRRSRWAVELEKRRGTNIAAVALANKNARTAWAVLRREARFDADHLPRAS